MKIAIIGAGVSGLSVYLWLRELGITDAHEVQVYERRPDNYSPETGQVDPQTYNASIIGGSIGLGANGLNTIKRLDKDLYRDVMNTGKLIDKWKLSAARGWTLAAVSAGPESVMIGREEFCVCFRKRVPSRVIDARKVVGIDFEDDGSKTLRFEEDSEKNVDLVIGADGIWSIVRRAMFADANADAEKYQYAPKYEGLVGVGSFFSSELLRGNPESQMNIVFGRNGFFSYGLDKGYDPKSQKYVDRGICWSSYTLRELPSDWRTIDTEDANRQLEARHSSWNIPIIQQLVKTINVDRVWPTFTVPPLPTLEKQGCVLVGDAAHALQPSSGQGASQALEDSEVLVRFLAHYLSKNPIHGHLLACKQYTELRMPRLVRVHKKAEQMGAMKADMSVFAEIMMYLVIWCIANVGPVFGLGKADQEYLYDYDAEQEVQQVLAKAESE